MYSRAQTYQPKLTWARCERVCVEPRLQNYQPGDMRVGAS